MVVVVLEGRQGGKRMVVLSSVTAVVFDDHFFYLPHCLVWLRPSEKGGTAVCLLG